MKRKESGQPLNENELSRLAVDPSDNFIPYGEGTAEVRLYRKFVREFLGSTKLDRAQRTGAEWHIDKKLKHVWKRYCGDDAYKHMTDEAKRSIMGKALFDAVGLHHPLEAVAEDYRNRQSASLTARYEPGLGAKVAEGLANALADKATLGVYTLVKIGMHLRDGSRRREIADAYAQRYGMVGTGSDDLDLRSLRGLDDDGTLGTAASFLAMKLDRFGRRQATLLAAQTLTVAGNAFSAVPGLGQGLSVGGSVVSGTVKAEQAFRNLKKRIEGNLGVARETMAVCLWGLGNRCHPPTLRFLRELGLLDDANELRQAGFFDRRNMRLASSFIARELSSTGRT